MEGPDLPYYQRVDRWAGLDKYRREVELLLRRLDLAPGSRVLEAGCGSGRAVTMLRRKGHHAIGLDRSRAWTSYCRTRPVLRADAAEMPFPDGSLDAVLLMHSLAHFVRPGRVLDETRRILRPGGRLGIVTPNLEFVSACRRLPGNGHSRYRPDPTVERHLDPGSLRSLLRRHHLGILFCEPVGRPMTDGRGSTVRERILAVAERPAVDPR